ncbi:MAG: hypothetical protein M1611_00945 [Candidatus Marsarchaeota archaeon]|jgi:hypothetical protein|nr:hypothetical protein [Candidatus Marsarchaeota archaeon]
MQENVNHQINIDFSKSDLKPIFADEIGIAVRVRAFTNEKGQLAEKEGQIGLIFLDMNKSLPVGEFIISKWTARGLVKNMMESLDRLEKELKSKEMPKQPNVKVSDSGSSSIR